VAGAELELVPGQIQESGQPGEDSTTAAAGLLPRQGIAGIKGAGVAAGGTAGGACTAPEKSLELESCHRVLVPSVCAA